MKPHLGLQFIDEEGVLHQCWQLLRGPVAVGIRDLHDDQVVRELYCSFVTEEQKGEFRNYITEYNKELKRKELELTSCTIQNKS